jgi:tetratricopeptide (TPR) repeat protein
MEVGNENIPNLDKLADKIAQVNINPQHVEQHVHLPNPPQSIPSNIPSPKGFIGSEVELVALRQARADGKTSFVLHGIGGVGKTDLALKFIEEIKADYSSHIRVDMFGLSNKPTTANDAKLEVIRMFKPDVPANLDEKDINNLYISLLNQHKTILFFDNAKDRDQVIPLCKDVPALVVITSRTNLYVTGCFSLPVEQMSPADARNLLYSVADEERYDGQADALAYLAGYLPMALLPLGGMLAEYITLEASELVEKYKERKERLQLADPNRENLTVMASFDLSYERLNDELQTCWRKLAVFPADFDLEAMQAVWQIAEGKAIRDELVKKHLLEFDKNTKRYHLHDLAHDYTGEKITPNEGAECEWRYFAYYGYFVSSLISTTTGNLNSFQIESTNIWHGLDYLTKLQNGDYPWVDRSNFKVLSCILQYAGAPIFLYRLQPNDYLKLQQFGLSVSRELKGQTVSGFDIALCEADFLRNIGTAYRSLGFLDFSISYQSQARKKFYEIKNKIGEAECLGNLGNAYLDKGDFKEAIKHSRLAIAIFKDEEHIVGLGREYNNLGLGMLMDNYPYDEVLSIFEQSLDFINTSLDTIARGNLLNSWGCLCLKFEKLNEALVFFDDCISVTKENGDILTMARAFENIGTTNLRLKKKDESSDI